MASCIERQTSEDDMKAFQESRWRKRMSEHNIPKLDIPPEMNNHIPGTGCQNLCNWSQTQSSEDCEEEGVELLSNFVLYEVEKEKDLVSKPDVKEMLDKTFSAVSCSISTPKGYKHSAWAKEGKILKEMADAFEKSKERQVIRDRANRVGLDEVDNQEGFYDLLTELFTTGGDVRITRERIMVLFVYISDLAIRFIKEKAMEYLKKMMTWAISFMRQKICTWVQEQGGWGNVLRNGVNICSYVLAALAASLISYSLYRQVKKWL
ncbi:unnamed protein product [Owenia fusiformis]|uniref:Uncharacterized protein n=1 Tax=Owenia fusiformis TaxID=6347 RepID=A0A8J1TXY4_OWEFU|nr:unnamed protein product [Owenia fusiformis]